MSDWKLPAPGAFSGIIGGPPCQPFSIATGSNESTHTDQIGEFWRICDYLKPDFAIMEEVVDAGVLNHPEIPADVRVAIVRDWDCGGNTERVRGFWHRGCNIIPPGKREGKGDWSVLARSWDKVVSDGPDRRTGLHSNLSARRACELQGFPEFMQHIEDERRVIPDKLIVHMMGNGVPRAMGEWVVRAVLGQQQTTLHGQTFSLDLEVA